MYNIDFNDTISLIRVYKLSVPKVLVSMSSLGIYDDTPSLFSLLFLGGFEYC